MSVPVGMRSAASAALLAIVLALGLAACGGGSSSSSGGTGESGATGGAGTEKTSTETGGNSGGADVAAAKKVIAPYIGQPSAFPVTEKLKEVPKGATVAFMDCGAPGCALIYELLDEAAKTMGVKLTRIKTGLAANTVSAAFDSVVAEKPAAVIVPSISVELWSKQLKELQEAEIPVVTLGVIGVEELGIPSPQAAEASSRLEGHLMANYVPAEMGTESNVVVYHSPELPFTTIVTEAFTEELEKVCPGCSVREVVIPASTYGNTAPSAVVSDLQAHPETTVGVFLSDEIEIGLPTALKSAGIEIETLGLSPNPPNLQYLKEGKETAALGFDFPVLVWSALDQAAREMAGQELTGNEAKGITDHQFLTQEDITFDPSKGWTGYPEFPEMFAKLWGVTR